MNDSKNLILAVVLSALVLIGWTWAANRYFPTAKRHISQTTQSSCAALKISKISKISNDPINEIRTF